MPDSIKDFIEITYNGNDVFVKINKTLPQQEWFPYGTVTKYIDSLNLHDIDYNALKSAYKQAAPDPVRIAKRQFGLISRFLIEKSADNMSCHLILLPHREKEKMIALPAILNELKGKGVIYGIKEEKIKNAIVNKIFKKKIIIATGMRPVPGRDTNLNPVVPCNTNLNDIADSYTTEDIYDRFEFIKQVRPGDIIAEIEHPTPGTSGLTISNETIPTVAGESIEITGSNIEISDNKVKTKINGRVLINGSCIDVEPLLVIDYAVNRDIRHQGSIIIQGDVESCRLIYATGDIEIHGVVSDTTMQAGRNIIIHSNLISQIDKPIVASRDFMARNISHATIFAENITILYSIISSNITAYRSIRTLTEEGHIIGGHISAGLSVYSKTIGNKNGVVTHIKVATPRLMNQIKKHMLHFYTRKIENINSIKETNIKKLLHVKRMRKLSAGNNIPAHELLTDIFMAESDRLEKEKSAYYMEIVKIKDPRHSLIAADITSDLFHANTIIEMGHGMREIKESRKRVRFSLKEGNILTELLDK